MTRVVRFFSLAALGFVLEGCPNKPTTCPETACSAGECVDGMCVMCTRGAEACTCLANGTCDTGLTCSAAKCAQCTAGVQGCPCGAGNTCNAGLKCAAGVCVPGTCTNGAQSCPCRGADPKCDGTLYCSSTTLCETCMPDVAGCACGAGNTCLGALICDSATTKCRAPVTCADLVTQNQCQAHQLCNQPAGGDAICVTMMCEANFKWDSRTSTCVACVTANCANEPTCTVGDAGDACDADSRVCVQSGSVAYCGACKAGFVEDTTMHCKPVITCNGITCADTDYCDTTVQPPACTTLPCPANQAKEVTGSCMPCTGLTCNSTGFTGRVWPFRPLGGGQCLCETLPGYFIPAGFAGQASRCDADDDGWVNENADNFTEPQRLANARCKIRKAETVRLEDELGTPLVLRSCVNGMTLAADAGACAMLPMRLLESENNDIPFSTGGKRPVYGQNGGADGGLGGTGRVLEAREINALTKACVDRADYNDDHSDDILEVQGSPASPDDQVRLRSFAFFLELHTSYFQSADGGNSGALVIRERTRCGADFPLHYATGPETYDLDAGQTYWRTCGRQRDPAYSQGAMKPNFDFARWACGASTGPCPALPVPHTTLVSPPTDPESTLVRGFGLCALNGAAPADGLWRGMAHHSQFKCVSVQSSPSANGYDVSPGDVADGGSYVFNQCSAHPCSSANDPSCDNTQGQGSQTLRPVIDCTVISTPPPNSIGFASVKYRPYGPTLAGYTATSYQGGCQNDDVETQSAMSGSGGQPIGSYLCPNPEFGNVFSVGTLSITQAGKSNAAFGRYSCYGDLPFFLWAEDAPVMPYKRAMLRWGIDPADMTNGVLR